MSTFAYGPNDPMFGNTRASRERAASITKAASKQSYYIVSLLVDRARTPAAYRAYAYFRWVDDTLDRPYIDRSTALAFVQRQQRLLDRGYQGKWPDDLNADEQMLAHLVESDRMPQSGLQIYLRCMMAVMTFDAQRRGRLITQRELDEYTHLLAKAVTEALHYFIGNGQYAPTNETRYQAATAAHIVHMLRDACEDVAMGYYNMPIEVLEAHKIGPQDVTLVPFRAWVRERLFLARRHFEAGEAYLAQVENLRCRLAGYLYMARFEMVSAAIEQDDYQLRTAYPECKNRRSAASMGWSMLVRNRNRGRRQVETAMVSQPDAENARERSAINWIGER